MCDRIYAPHGLRSSASVCRSRRVGPPTIAARSTVRGLSSYAAVYETTAWRGGVTPNASRSSCLLGGRQALSPRIDLVHQKGPALQVDHGWLAGNWARLTVSGKPGPVLTVETVLLRRPKV